MEWSNKKCPGHNIMLTDMSRAIVGEKIRQWLLKAILVTYNIVLWSEVNFMNGNEKGYNK